MYRSLSSRETFLTPKHEVNEEILAFSKIAFAQLKPKPKPNFEKIKITLYRRRYFNK
jgi:hypothetical protein